MRKSILFVCALAACSSGRLPAPEESDSEQALNAAGTSSTSNVNVVGWQTMTPVNTRNLSAGTDSTTVVQGGPWSVSGSVNAAIRNLDSTSDSMTVVQSAPWTVVQGGPWNVTGSVNAAINGPVGVTQAGPFNVTGAVQASLSNAVSIASGQSIGIDPASNGVTVTSLPARRSFLAAIRVFTAAQPDGTISAPPGSHLSLKRFHGKAFIAGSTPPEYLELYVRPAMPTAEVTLGTGGLAQQATADEIMIEAPAITVTLAGAFYVFDLALYDLRASSVDFGSTNTTTVNSQFEAYLDGDVVP
jgi:hypothetical protein